MESFHTACAAGAEDTGVRQGVVGSDTDRKDPSWRAAPLQRKLSIRVDSEFRHWKRARQKFNYPLCQQIGLVGSGLCRVTVPSLLSALVVQCGKLRQRIPSRLFQRNGVGGLAVSIPQHSQGIAAIQAKGVVEKTWERVHIIRYLSV